MGSVSHELPDLGLRALARGQGRVNMVEEDAERGTDLPHLLGGGQVLIIHALVDAHLAVGQGLGGHTLGRGGHTLQRPEGGADHGAPDGGGDDGADTSDDGLDEELGTDELVVRGHGQAGDDDLAGL